MRVRLLPVAIFSSALALAGGLPFSTPLCAQESADRLVRDTAPLSPEKQRETFKVPAGFEVQLFADDAQLGGKPINMAFDAKGRLWVTSTREYPYAVPKDRWQDSGTRARGAQDSIRVLEDTNGDGRADRVTVFADELNIPTGVLPWKNGCIAWSIPNIVHFEDTNGDGICDKRTILFGPLGYEKDTHGMISSLRLGLDGWVYATHGFSNTSHFKAKDGSTLDLNSGNVFRFKPDGSRVERWTTGQVNPFGLCWDSWGNLYSADCHSSPIYQLLPGASYPSFGKPHDGLGFAPVMCEHAHGSTGIAGVVYLDQNVWGQEWNDHMLVGNPVTSKVNLDHITFTGSTPKANERPDFIDCTDPWFRPVDLQMGPDSAVYIADFYNRIIGHYEVPLEHPGRDRNSGRIWRVVRKGITKNLPAVSLGGDTPDQVVKTLGGANLTLRGLAFQEVSQGLKGQQAAAYQQALKQAQIDTQNPMQRALVARLTSAASGAPSTALEASHISRAATRDKLPDFRHRDPRVAAIALQQIAVMETGPQFQEILPVRSSILPGDATLKYSWLLAMRATLMRTGDWNTLPQDPLADGAEADVLKVATSIPTPASANWVIQRLHRLGSPEYFRTLGDMNPLLSHAARFSGVEREAELVALVQKCQPDNLDAQLSLFAAIMEGRKLAGQRPGSAMAGWAEALQSKLTRWSMETTLSGWNRSTLPGTPASETSPWFQQRRISEDGAEGLFMCSNPPGGEKLRGMLASPAFELPDTLSFWIAGHRGFTSNPPHDKNLIRLRDLDSGEVLALAYPPRDDKAHAISWNFVEQKRAWEKQGSLPRRVSLEFVDGDDGKAYAWLAVGRFGPEVPPLPDDEPQTRNNRIAALASLVRDFPTEKGVAQLRSLPGKLQFQAKTKVALAEALASGLPQYQSLAILARDGDLGPVVFKVLEIPTEGEAQLAKVFKDQPYSTQVKLATAMAATPEQSAQLLQMASPRALADPVVTGKLKALNQPEITAKLTALTQAVPQVDEGLNEQIRARLKAFAQSGGKAAQGEQVFQTYCAVCHRIGVKGNLVGPQLDGIGSRGAERLMEDILDPNRAVDPAFRMHFLKLKSGEVTGGLLRREQDGVLVIADAAGQEHAVEKSDVAEHQESPFSLMPAGMNEVLGGQVLLDLMAYLLERKS